MSLTFLSFQVRPIQDRLHRPLPECHLVEQIVMAGSGGVPWEGLSYAPLGGPGSFSQPMLQDKMTGPSPSGGTSASQRHAVAPQG